MDSRDSKFWLRISVGIIAAAMMLPLWFDLWQSAGAASGGSGHCLHSRTGERLTYVYHATEGVLALAGECGVGETAAGALAANNAQSGWSTPGGVDVPAGATGFTARGLLDLDADRQHFRWQEPPEGWPARIAQAALVITGMGILLTVLSSMALALPVTGGDE